MLPEVHGINKALDPDKRPEHDLDRTRRQKQIAQEAEKSRNNSRTSKKTSINDIRRKLVKRSCRQLHKRKEEEVLNPTLQEETDTMHPEQREESEIEERDETEDLLSGTNKDRQTIGEEIEKEK